jgi:hypothetical protein
MLLGSSNLEDKVLIYQFICLTFMIFSVSLFLVTILSAHSIKITCCNDYRLNDVSLLLKSSGHIIVLIAWQPWLTCKLLTCKFTSKRRVTRKTTGSHYRHPQDWGIGKWGSRDRLKEKVSK